VLFVLTALQPLVELGDRLRQLPVRQVAATIVEQRRPDEPLAMVGVLKPSLHFYTRQVVLFEGLQPNGPINLDERLRLERRAGLSPSPVAANTLLLVIDRRTATLPHWQGLPHTRIDQRGLYELWRVRRAALHDQANRLLAAGSTGPDWQRPRPERY
jgi:hypothetical protein